MQPEIYTGTTKLQQNQLSSAILYLLLTLLFVESMS